MVADVSIPDVADADLPYLNPIRLNQNDGSDTRLFQLEAESCSVLLHALLGIPQRLLKNRFSKVQSSDQKTSSNRVYKVQLRLEKTTASSIFSFPLQNMIHETRFEMHVFVPFSRSLQIHLKSKNIGFFRSNCCPNHWFVRFPITGYRVSRPIILHFYTCPRVMITTCFEQFVRHVMSLGGVFPAEMSSSQVIMKKSITMCLRVRRDRGIGRKEQEKIEEDED